GSIHMDPLVSFLSSFFLLISFLARSHDTHKPGSFRQAILLPHHPVTTSNCRVIILGRFHLGSSGLFPVLFFPRGLTSLFTSCINVPHCFLPSVLAFVSPIVSSGPFPRRSKL
ncbi:uncharacterized protein EI90DRAFT_3033822, partial [Cantharellus anzutake]|uniref:uncharacterized protein n=1 Tax=Cantharellus anzutake TaxID=1750568 RepID=UPI001905F1EA